MLKENFSDLYNTYKRSIIKSILIKSITLTCTTLFIVGIITWFINPSKIWISCISSAVLFCTYFSTSIIFKLPTEKSFARKLDELGLKQRAITMNDYKDDDSLMARIQRQNAIEHICRVDKRLIKKAIPVSLIIIFFVSVLLSITTTTVCVLANENILDDGKTVIEDVVPGLKNQYEVIYDIDGEGFIEGEFFQIVQEGEDATSVLAIPEEGWAFLKWSDKLTEIFRQDKEIYGDLEIIAIFQELDEQDQGEGEGEGEGQPSDEEQEGKPSDEEGQSNPSEQPGDPNDQEGGGMGGSYEPNNQVIDGETYYGGSTYDNAYGDAMNNVQGNNNISEEGKGVIEDYFKAIQH